MFKYYYDENLKKALGYYCRYKNIDFKTKAEYDAYLKENEITAKKILCWEQAKVSSTSRFDKDGTWNEKEIAPGTIVYNNRSLYQYTVEDQKAFDRLMQCVTKYNDNYIDRCYWENGYDNLDDYTYQDSDEVIPEFDPTQENQTYAFYIISYMPDDETVRASRMSNHLLQIKNLKRLAPNTRIYVIAQNWKDAEYLDDAQITYYKFGALGAGVARNTALRLFYNTNYDYMCLSDDDITLKETNSAKEFFRELKENPGKFIDMDIIQNRCLVYNPFEYSDLLNSDFTSENWHFVQTWEGQIHLTFFKNFKKYYDVEEYQDEEMTPSENTGFDDIDFYLTLDGKGYKNYVATFLFRYMGCMREESSTIETVQNGCFVYDNLCAARRKHLDRLPNGNWDYWKLQAPTEDINLLRENKGDTYSEMSGHLIDALKVRYEKEKQPTIIDELVEKDKTETPIDNDYLIY